MQEVTNQKLIEDNLKLVYFIVSKEYPTYIRDEDIIQSGMVGLCKAAQNWDKTKSKFSTYAGRCIRNEINQEFINRKPHSNTVSLNTKIGDDGTLCDVIIGEDDVNYVDDTFYYGLGTDEQMVVNYDRDGYSTAEISSLTGFTIDKVRKILRLVKIKWRNFDGDSN